MNIHAPIKFIAEIGSNHNNDYTRIQKLISAASALGFWGVKFQAFDGTLYCSGDKRNEIAFDRSLGGTGGLYEAKEMCRELGLKFLCTPFTMDYAKALSDIVDYYKISSFDILRKDLINYCVGHSNNCVFISTGLATQRNIVEMLSDIEQNYQNYNICLMHCVSKYPTKKKESCVEYIYQLKNLYEARVAHFGYSDHTADIEVIKAAIECGAEAVELHFDLNDKKGAEYQYGHCWTENKIIKLAKKLENVQKRIDLNNFTKYERKYGSWKSPTIEELAERADPSDGRRPMLSARNQHS